MLKINLSIISVFILVLANCRHENNLPQRDIRPFDWKEVYTLPNDELEFSIVNRMTFNEHGLFIHDFVNKKVHLINIHTNEILRSFGGRGQGPGEIGMLIDFSVYENRLITIDTQLLRFTEYNIQTGEVVSTIHSNTALPLDLVVFDNYYIVTSGVADSLLTLYDAKTGDILSSSSILNLDLLSEYAMSVTGRLHKMTDSSLIYLPRHDHRIFEFLVNGEALHRGRIYESSLDTFTFKPSIDQSSDSQKRIQAPSTNYTLKSDFAPFKSGYITSFHLAGTHPTQRFISYLDILDSDLNYKYSLGDFYPKSLGDFAVYETTLCILFGNSSISCYEIPEHLR